MYGGKSVNIFKKIGKNITNSFKKNSFANYICVIGGTNLDIIGTSANLKQRESTSGSIRVSPGGVARNIAENLGRLGETVQFISAVGVDPFGSQILESLKKIGIGVSATRRITNQKTGIYLALLNDERSVDVSINDMNISSFINREWIKKCETLVRNASIVIFDCNLRHDSIDEIINLAKGKIMVDTVSVSKASNIMPFISNVWALRPTIKEAEVLTGIKIKNEVQMLESIRILHEKGVKNIMMSLDEKSVIASNGLILKKYSFEKTKRISQTGVGDAFLAAWASKTMDDVSVFEAARYALVLSNYTESCIETVNENLTEANLELWTSKERIEESTITY